MESVQTKLYGMIMHLFSTRRIGRGRQLSRGSTRMKHFLNSLCYPLQDRIEYLFVCFICFKVVSILFWVSLCLNTCRTWRKKSLSILLSAMQPVNFADVWLNRHFFWRDTSDIDFFSPSKDPSRLSLISLDEERRNIHPRSHHFSARYALFFFFAFLSLYQLESWQ